MFLPFSRPTIDEDMIAAVGDVLRSQWISTGPRARAFEEALSERHAHRPTRVLTSATAAMEVALQICGIGKGEEVITSAMSFFAAPNMVLKTGATPVFVDCDLTSRNIDLDQVEAAITPRTRALLPTHFSGMPCDMDRLYKIAQDHELRVIEDAALALGSSWRGRPIGSFGDICAFSFHPNKNITTIEGGALTFADEHEARRCELLRFHGIMRLADGTRDVGFAAGKFNLSDVSAELGIRQLRRLDDFIDARRNLAEHYFECFRTFPCTPAPVLPARGHPGDENGHSWNMFCVLLPLDEIRISRQQFISEMEGRGIGIGISYEALHLTTLCRPLGYQQGVFPNAERIARETVTLPLFPGMTREDVERVVEELSDVLMQAAR
jgi:hypothetical protein